MVSNSKKGKTIISAKPVWFLLALIFMTLTGLIIGNRLFFTEKSATANSDLSVLLGDDFSKAEKILGESVPIISENTRYFEKSGVSVVYDAGDERIIYVDIDGSIIDNSAYDLMGISTGMTRKQIKKLFDKEGYEPADCNSDFWSYDFVDNNIKKELSVEFNDDKAIMITFKEVN